MAVLEICLEILTNFFEILHPPLNIHRKTPLLEFLFNSKYCEIFKSSYFVEHLRTAASENVFMKPYDETEKK